MPPKIKSRRYVDHYAGERKQDCTTPKAFFAALNARYGFTLDGASSPDNALLPRFSTEAAELSWEGERVFCNPPWSNIAPFVERAITASFAVLLVPARTNVRWFHRALELGAKPEYWVGRLSFREPHNSPVDCLLLVFGGENGAG